ncbi:hypothetical protein AVEN_208043-1 [Araneus ventricosus]|uniref:Uncharacterized protein n=1 Tax=Araneus ventricosus TaxID=182803 RepID=A0A4Y2F159_ARAVE|nr:hypothetical protein AVEN_208043-1 [Araneus ventricosus]
MNTVRAKWIKVSTWYSLRNFLSASNFGSNASTDDQFTRVYVNAITRHNGLDECNSARSFLYHDWRSASNFGSNASTDDQFTRVYVNAITRHNGLDKCNSARSFLHHDWRSVSNFGSNALTDDQFTCVYVNLLLEILCSLTSPVNRLEGSLT